MKQIIYTLIALLLAGSTFAGTITAVDSNNWTDKASWNPSRKPQSNDTIIIPAGITITLDKNVSLNNAVVLIYGTLRLDNGKLSLNDHSQVTIESTGRLTGDNSNDQIRIGHDIKYTGKQGTIYGYSYADYTTGSAPSAGFITFTLPVHFTSFYASLSGNDVKLSWSTDKEINNDHFEVEKSVDGSTWNKIASVKGNGNSSSNQQYAYTDRNAASGTSYYRIRQVDQNGMSYYSSVRTVKSGAAASAAHIYAAGPQTLHIDFNSSVGNEVNVKVLNLNGQVIASQAFSGNAYQVSMNLNNARGLMLVLVTDNAGMKQVQKVLF